MAESKMPDPKGILIELYQKRIRGAGVGAASLPSHNTPKSRAERLAHALSLCLELQRHLEEWRPGKIERKLAFIQGILWSEGLYTQSQIRGHNRGL